MIDQSIPLVTLVRRTTGADGTFGDLTNTVTGHTWKTAELEWLDNQLNISCIPAISQDESGQYLVDMRPHPKHANLGDLVGMPGLCYEILNVLNRVAILMHIANWAGQESDGEKTDLLGCVGIGEDIEKMTPPGYPKPQEEVAHSTQAVTEFYKEMGGKPFRLKITDSF